MTEDHERFSSDDEQILHSFFAEQKVDIPDDGFSDKVMEKLPYADNRRLMRCWQIACAIIGIVILFVGQFWGNLQDMLFSSKVEGTMMLAKLVCRLGESLAHTQNLLMYVVGMAVILVVWGYNEVLDARNK